MKADVSNYDANIAKARKQLDGFRKDNLSMGGVMKQLSGTLTSTAARFASVTAGVGALGAAIASNIETAKNFQLSMSQLSSLTGKTGEDLNTLKEYAIELGSSTTLSASQVADAFKMIGSQQPQLLSSSEALKAVTKNAITLSEAAGIDLQTAAQTLSTSINQMGGDSNNAERYINVLAAAAQNGAGDIAWLGEAITKSATAAKAVGTDYEELVANLEQLAKAGFDASTAGTALRSIIMNLEKQANKDFKPSIVGLTQAFENLKKANLDIVGYQEIAGKMFASQAMALADAAGEAKKMQEAITGTNTAEEQARINTDNLDGSLKSLASAWEGLNLHINSSNGILKSTVDWFTGLIRQLDSVTSSAGRAAAALARLNGGGGGQSSKVDRLISNLGDGKTQGQRNIYTNQLKEFDRYINQLQTKIANGGKLPGAPSGTSRDIRSLEAELTAAMRMREEYVSRAKAILNPQSIMQQAAAETTTTPTTSTTKGGKKSTKSIEEDVLRQYEAAMRKAESMADSFKAPEMSGPSDAFNKYAEAVKQGADNASESVTSLTDAFKRLNEVEGVQVGQGGKVNESVEAIGKAAAITASIVSTIGTAFNAIEDPAAKVAGTIAMSIAQIALAYAQALAADPTLKTSVYGLIAGAAAAMVSMVTTIGTVKSSARYAEGGIVQGNTYSNDQIPASLNAGEVVLNAAQSGNLASRLQDGDGGGRQRPSYITGEQIWIAMNRYTRRTGQGEVVTWR
jgi:TP901 family phage tail tape measure protein